jgi:Na+/melibiose symporter-like transporter
MPACPECRHWLSPHGITERFPCPKCETPLASNSRKIFKTFLVVLVLTEILLFFLIDRLGGKDNPTAFVALCWAAAILGPPACYWIFMTLKCRVERDKNPDDSTAESGRAQ